MRDRLIALLKSPHKAEQLRKIGVAIGNYEDDCVESMIADYLLTNGVIVPPCKVGDMLYDIYEAKSNGEGNIRELKVPEIHINFDRRNRPWIVISGYYFALEDFGKTVFFSREEAEAALKGK